MYNEFLSKTEGFGFGPGGVPGRAAGVSSLTITRVVIPLEASDALLTSYGPKDPKTTEKYPCVWMDSIGRNMTC